GSAVLGLGNIGPGAGLPVMEGKAVLFKTFGGVEAFPICLRTQDIDEIVRTVKLIAPVFGGINLEDIAAPHCFEIEQRLSDELDIPIFHDDQHGTAVVVLAGMMNALKLVDKKISDIRIVVNGAGAAALSVSKLLMKSGAKDIIICDTKGVIHKGRKDGMNPYKHRIAEITNLANEKGALDQVMKGADLFLGLSAPGTLTTQMIQMMAKDPVIFALANPTPEIMPDEAYAAGARVVATGRSDFPNQVNNSLAFPGIFRGALDVRAKNINDEMKIAAAQAIAALISENELEHQKIIPGALDFRVPPAVASAVAQAANDTKESRKVMDPKVVAANLKHYLYDGHLAKATTPSSM
ncbi:MAG: NADP-dependent malic enzyme, partial [Cyanobacteria bacterium]|nr:NADP-dependent malic enzyme [Cyanobacteriota bacterium]